MLLARSGISFEEAPCVVIESEELPKVTVLVTVL
jgi:hypothetical protein